MALSDNLAGPLFQHATATPDRVAIWADGSTLTYAEVAAQARRVAGRLCDVAGTRRVGILASRSSTACIGILGSAWAGSAYVPLNLRLPEERLIQLLSQLDLDALVVDAQGLGCLTDALLAIAPRTIIVADNAAAFEARCPDAVRLRDLPDAGPEQPLAVAANDLAYIAFTSGTTGVPKGVMVEVGGVNTYLAVMHEHARLRPDDRVAETCDITFDTSGHNMFLTWYAGAALHIMARPQMVTPARFIREHEITAWMSVPSIVSFMRKSRTLAPDSLPSLRLTWFVGEPLPLSTVQDWAKAAPNSIIENAYGPSEVTIGCTWQTVGDPPEVTPGRDVIAIGRPHPGTQAMIVDEQLRPLPPGTPGELALSGAQLSRGYFEQPELTARRFPMIDGKRWYLTGDLAMVDEDGRFHHLGRVDNQVKILGIRIELEDIEFHLRDATGSDQVAAIPWPWRDGLAEGLVAVVAGQGCAQTVRDAMKSRVAAYMVPSNVHFLDALPLSHNGKVDRKAITALLDAGTL